MEKGRAPEPSLAAGEGVLPARKAWWPGALTARRASRAALRCAAFSILKLPRFCDQIPPPSPGTPFSFRGIMPKTGALGHGRSSSEEATASESGVALPRGCEAIRSHINKSGEKREKDLRSFRINRIKKYLDNTVSTKAILDKPWGQCLRLCALCATKRREECDAQKMDPAMQQTSRRRTVTVA